MNSTYDSQPIEKAPQRGLCGYATVWVVCCVAIAGVLVLLPQAGASAFNPDQQLEQDLVLLTNADRTSNGAAALLIDDRLVGVARERSDDMVTRNYFAHEIPPAGTRVFDLILQRGVDYELAAENIGYNNAPRQRSVQHIQGEFMKSPAHRANLLRANWNFLGIGAVPGSDRVMYTVLFMKPFPSDASAARLAPTPQPTTNTGAQPAAGSGGLIEQIVDDVLTRNLGLPGAD